jgi:hydroxyacylglutathione hydrolase
MIQLHKFIFNPFQENTFLVWHKETRETIIVDPGCSNANEEQELSNYISENRLIVKYLINTHCHIDHVLGNKYIKEKYGCDYYAPQLDIPLLENVVKQAEMFGLQIDPSPLPDQYITEDLKLYIGNSEISFLFTPGHTPGEYCIIFKEDKICISGDVLFLEGIGRTDLWGGDYDTLLRSIRNQLFALDDEYSVFPGHGDKTTIGHEKQNNPFLK